MSDEIERIKERLEEITNTDISHKPNLNGANVFQIAITGRPQAHAVKQTLVSILQKFHNHDFVGVQNERELAENLLKAECTLNISFKAAKCLADQSMDELISVMLRVEGEAEARWYSR